jgi:trehalose 6-phosphate phosphatase
MPAQAPPIDAGNSALFLDLDGTLLEIEAHPDMVRMPADVRSTIEAVAAATGGCLALVSGRSLDALDRIVFPLSLAASGTHGAEFRPEGGSKASVIGWTPPTWLKEQIEELAARRESVVIEYKPASVAVHFRACPAAKPEIENLLDAASGRLGGEVELMAGKMVLELRRSGCSKGSAIRQFMALPRMRNRTPVFIGDDVTDEDGFTVVNALGGLSIKVGDPNGTSALYSLKNVAAVHAWLHSLLNIKRRASL